jgi:hypothetical protein
MLSPAPLRRFLWVVLSGCVINAIYTYFKHESPTAGALAGASIGAMLFSLERFVLRHNAGAFFNRLQFLPYLGGAVAGVVGI